MKALVPGWSESKKYKIDFAFGTKFDTSTTLHGTTASYTDFRRLLVAFSPDGLTKTPFNESASANRTATNVLRKSSTCQELCAYSINGRYNSADKKRYDYNNELMAMPHCMGLQCWNSTNEYGSYRFSGTTPYFPGTLNFLCLYNQSAEVSVRLELYEYQN